MTALVIILALGIMRSASPLFKKLQKLLDRMTTILLENITGVRVCAPSTMRSGNKTG